MVWLASLSKTRKNRCCFQFLKPIFSEVIVMGLVLTATQSELEYSTTQPTRQFNEMVIQLKFKVKICSNKHMTHIYQMYHLTYISNTHSFPYSILKLKKKDQKKPSFSKSKLRKIYRNSKLVNFFKSVEFAAFQ